MFHYNYKTEGTCSQVISLDLDGRRKITIRYFTRGGICLLPRRVIFR